MSKLRESAQGQDCHVRIPWICNGNPETTVLAHIRRGGVAGIGKKPPYVCGVFACSDCHDVIDGRTPLADANMGTVSMYVLDGHMRTLKWWVDNGYL